MKYQIALLGMVIFYWIVLFYGDYIYENNVEIERFSFLNKERIQ